jgi:hypothetical protein
MACLHAAGPTSTDHGATATICRIQVSFLPDNASALPNAKNFDGRLGRVRHAPHFLLSAFLDRIVDERGLPPM